MSHQGWIKRTLSGALIAGTIAGGSTVLASAPAQASGDDCWYCTANIDNPTRSEWHSGKFDLGLMVFTVHLGFFPTQKNVTVNYTTADGIGPNAATAAAGDYKPTNGTLTFQANKSNIASIFVPIPNNNSSGPNKKFRVQLTGISDGHIGQGVGTGTILTDNPGRLNVIAAPDVNQGEPLKFKVQLSKAYTTPVTVHYMTINQTAVSPTNYTPTNGTLTFAPGQFFKEVDVPTIDDNRYDQPPRTMILQIFTPTGAPLGDVTAEGKLYDPHHIS
jgi:hypothetical protein